MKHPHVAVLIGLREAGQPMASKTFSRRHCCAGAPFIVGSFLVFIALIVGLCIRQSEVQQSEVPAALQESLLGKVTRHCPPCSA